MTVYVDNAAIPYGRMKMHHMVADSTEELYRMVDSIGVQRRWIQNRGSYREHFDISAQKRLQAIVYGAVDVTAQQLAAMVRRRQHTGSLGKPVDAIAWYDEYLAKLRESE